MSYEELDRVRVIERVVEKRLTQREAARMLGLTSRQVRRLERAYARDGAGSLASKHRGRPSNRRLASDLRREALATVRSRYEGFGATLAHEKLTELHGLKLSVETLRHWMIEDGLWIPRARREPRVQQPRRRRPCRGGGAARCLGCRGAARARRRRPDHRLLRKHPRELEGHRWQHVDGPRWSSACRGGRRPPDRPTSRTRCRRAYAFRYRIRVDSTGLGDERGHAGAVGAEARGDRHAGGHANDRLLRVVHGPHGP